MSGAIIQHVTDNHVLLVIHDITIHKQVEREREDLIGFVAHELRNPLANVTLCNEIMTEAIGTNNMEEIGEMLQRSKNNVKRLNKMIADFYKPFHKTVETTTKDAERVSGERLLGTDPVSGEHDRTFGMTRI